MQTTLDTFRTLLGKTNDGNIVFTLDAQGLEKANHGNRLTRATKHYRVAENNADENRQVRNLLMQSIVSSQEGHAFTAEQLDYLRAKLGVSANPDETSDAALGRKELKLVLDLVDTIVATGSVPQPKKAKGAAALPLPLFGNLLVARQKVMLQQKGLPKGLVDQAFSAAQQVLESENFFKNPKNMAKSLPPTLCGHPKAEVQKFLMANYRAVQSMVADRVVWDCLETFANLPPRRPGPSQGNRQPFL